MPARFDLDDLEKINTESELAFKRLERMIEFLRVVCHREAVVLNENQTSQSDEPELFVRRTD